jgi:hypothetical protein
MAAARRSCEWIGAGRGGIVEFLRYFPERHMPTAGNSQPAEKDALAALSLAEFQGLRSEILQLTQMQSQLIALTVVAFGTVVSIGFQAKNPAIVLVHPILALIIGVSWMNHAHSVRRCADYIRARETAMGALTSFGWEHYVRDTPFPKHYVGFWGVRAIFAISSVVALGASLGVKLPHGPVIALFALSSLVTAVLFWLSFAWQEGAGEPRGGAGRAGGGSGSPSRSPAAGAGG